MFTAPTRVSTRRTVTPSGRSSGRTTARTIAGAVVLSVVVGACGGGSPTPEAQRPGTVDSTSNVAGRAQAAASPSTAPKALVVGRRSSNLDFPVVADTGSPSTPNPFAATTTAPATATVASSPGEAATHLLKALNGQRVDEAWAALSPTERTKLGYPQRLAEDVAGAGWTSFTVTAVNDGTVTAEVQQTPKISDIDGVVASRARLELPTVQDGSNYSVLWSRRRIEQLYPERTQTSDRTVGQVVVDWAASRQDCGIGVHEYSGGLLGVVGLATALCNAAGTIEIGPVGDLDALDEPQPVLDAFGGSALLWARVVPITAPVPMNVIVAPEGDAWRIVGLARASLVS